MGICGMKKIMLTLLAVAAVFSARAEIELAKNGATEHTIIYKFSGDVLLDPAVKDLADTLKAITGAKFEIAEEADGPKIFIGVTPPGERPEFASRERCIKSVGNDLYIYGDYRYGTA